jgi:hypothetical protein
VVDRIAVAVLDTGIARDQLPGADILPGLDLTGEGSPDCDDSAELHGTRVARTILSEAPMAALVPVRLVTRCGLIRGRELVEEAVDWVLAERERLRIGVVCLSFADDTNEPSDELHRASRLPSLIGALRRAGIPTVCAAGNWRLHRSNPADQGMAWPAVIRETVSVGALAVGADGTIGLSRVSQRLHPGAGTGCSTTMFALPGEPGESSGATAVAAGRLADLRRTAPDTTVAALIATLLSRGGPVRDDRGVAVRVDLQGDDMLDWPSIHRVGGTAPTG